MEWHFNIPKAITKPTKEAMKSIPFWVKFYYYSMEFQNAIRKAVAKSKSSVAP